MVLQLLLEFFADWWCSEASLHEVKLFQHLRDAGDTGLPPSVLAEKTGVTLTLLERTIRHLIAMKLLTFHNGKVYGSHLTDGLAAENYQQSIDFCYDVARPSFNHFPKLLLARWCE